MSLPETQFADSDGLSIAYQVMGDGDQDLIIAPGLISHVELLHDFPGYTRYLRRLSAFTRVISFDKRGQGLSDPLEGTPTLQERMDDLIAVLDAAGSRRASILGYSEGGPLAFLTAATHPDRISRIIAVGAYGKACASPAYPHMHRESVRRENLLTWLEDWGRGGGVALSALAPHLATDAAMCKMFARIERFAGTPNAMRRYFDVNFAIDVLDILPAVQTETLVLHRQDDQQVPFAAGRHLAEMLPKAQFVPAGAGGHVFWVGETETSLDAIRDFLAGDQDRIVNKDRVLATVLMTDIVGSTELAQRHGDDVWRDMLDRHDQAISESIALHRGRLIKSTGDGVLATFDGPDRALESALQLVERMDEIGLSIRVGVHTGEIELRGDDIGGINVHLAARIQSLADAREILVSRTVADLLVGKTDIHFDSRGLQRLKGIENEWEVFQVKR
ncbi:MAG: adenylate/guanylate cyclase domain-containing protein [Pseudomonadota bacterium]